jgi:Arc/MetJ family transcription regulator
VRTTLNIDDELLARAASLGGELNRTALIREGLKAFVERESAKRLAQLGGSQPNLSVARRRRQKAPG